MNASKEDVHDFNFIVSEAMRIAQLLNGNDFRKAFAKEYYRELGSMGLTIEPPIELHLSFNDNDYRQINLSYDSHDAFYKIAQRQIRCNKLEMLITANEFVEVLKLAIYKHIFIEDGEFDQKGCTDLLNKTFDTLKKMMKKEDFYFPLLAFGLSDSRFSFKIAEIIPRAEIFKIVEMSIDPFFLAEAEEFCNANEHPYNYFLKVSISKRTKKSRERTAYQVAEFIVGVIHLLSEQYNIDPKFISLSTAPYPKFNTFWFSKDNNENWDFKLSMKQVAAFSPDFWINFKKDFDSDLGTALCEIARLAVEPKDNRIIADRLIDAIFIFSSALQDKDESSRVVKLVTALERLVSLKNEKDENATSKYFRSRVSSFVAIFHGDKERWSTIAREMYSLRSDIVHGSWSLYRNVEPLYVGQYSDLTSKAILSACVGFFSLGLEKDDSEATLKKFYIYLEHLASNKSLP
ncbi:HEPN domain-containing protein [Serratia fonticola]|uniref:HEPN domain-containing protein n=1 Tax=Serratia fonticola TaxID=47917 RepID=UPI00192C3B33|nr:HEPN domain-containing protein [Serratia fonticola]MBL5827141.1 hypothetical protein [Serratia fonticola]MBL5864200.1 hypothetical protein [Serratia fonticola]